MKDVSFVEIIETLWGGREGGREGEREGGRKGGKEREERERELTKIKCQNACLKCFSTHKRNLQFIEARALN